MIPSYTNPIAWENLPHHWNLSLIYTVCTALIRYSLPVQAEFSLTLYQIWIFIELLFVYFFYVETRGPTLEELAKIFDGEDAAVAHVDMYQVEKEVEATHHERAA
jgi:hypothetical protein